MGKKDFDNIMKLHEGAVVFTADTIGSLELDLELPRGFIAKIWKMMLIVELINEDLEGISVDKIITYKVCLIRDPDDSTSVSIPTNEVQHDVIMDHQVDVALIAGVAGDSGLAVSINRKEIDIPEHVDLITARNMRLNVVATGSDKADATEAVGTSQIYYTLEEVKDADILELLDIL